MLELTRQHWGWHSLQKWQQGTSGIRIEGFFAPKGFQDRSIHGCFSDSEEAAAGRMGSGQGPLENIRVAGASGQWLASGIKWDLLAIPISTALGEGRSLSHE